MKKLFVLMIGFMFLFTGCAGFLQQTAPSYTDTQKAAYLKADMEYVKLLQRYYVYKDVQPVSIQVDWEQEIEPILAEADLLLDAWKLVMLQGGDIATAEAEFIAVKNKIIDWTAKNFVE